MRPREWFSMNGVRFPVLLRLSAARKELHEELFGNYVVVGRFPSNLSSRPRLTVAVTNVNAGSQTTGVSAALLFSSIHLFLIGFLSGLVSDHGSSARLVSCHHVL